jgi:hypothetical protein
MIRECYKLLKTIEHRPAMWTGENSLKSIHLYASGYYQALLDQKVHTNAHTDEPFFDWVANKLGYYESTAGWVNMIVAYSIGFDSANIDWNVALNHSITKEEHSKSIFNFYEMLEEFISEMEKND